MSRGMAHSQKRDVKYAEVRSYWGIAKNEARYRAMIDKQIEKGMPPLFVRNCIKCGCPLGFGQTHTGKLIPLDLRAPVYTVVFEKTDSHGVQVTRTQLAFVSHFATCKFADEFSGSKKDES